MTLAVPKTYKLFVGGKFPRSESGRSFAPATNPDINVARGSRKDRRDAVLAAPKGLAAALGGMSLGVGPATPIEVRGLTGHLVIFSDFEVFFCVEQFGPILGPDERV